MAQAAFQASICNLQSNSSELGNLSLKLSNLSSSRGAPIARTPGFAKRRVLQQAGVPLIKFVENGNSALRSSMSVREHADKMKCRIGPYTPFASFASDGNRVSGPLDIKNGRSANVNKIQFCGGKGEHFLAQRYEDTMMHSIKHLQDGSPEIKKIKLRRKQLSGLVSNEQALIDELEQRLDDALAKRDGRRERGHDVIRRKKEDDEEQFKTLSSGSSWSKLPASVPTLSPAYVCTSYVMDRDLSSPELLNQTSFYLSKTKSAPALGQAASPSVDETTKLALNSIRDLTVRPDTRLRIIDIFRRSANGCVEPAVFRAGLQECGVTMGNEEFSQVLALIDPHGTGSLKYEEVDYVLTQFAAMEAGGYE